MLLLALALAAAPPDSLDALLSRGPLVSVETSAGGKFAAAVGFLDVSAPPAKVWEVLTGFGAYREFVPKVMKSEAQAFTGGARVKFEIESPGPNTTYTVQYALDAATRTAEGLQVSGDLRGSSWKWELFELEPGRTRVRYTSRARNFSSILSALEDEQETVTAGLNVGAAITMLRALKKRCEQLLVK